MKYVLVIPQHVERTLRDHLFQSELEQAAFLFARPVEISDELRMEATDIYAVPREGWDVQLEVYLELNDSERAKIMKMARDRGLAIIDCHSHPGSGDDVWFSPSDKDGITDFAGYVKWKLDGKPYTAMVWGESSIDAVIWHGDFSQACKVDEVHVVNDPTTALIPRGTWFRKPRPFWQVKRNG